MNTTNDRPESIWTTVAKMDKPEAATRPAFEQKRVIGSGGRPRTVWVCKAHGCWLNASQAAKHKV